ncbi:MAG TPA: hypothetical protein VNT25_02385 [Allosphingosinicella sp.]|nr:hypothetical protein [Allosphingosinicella sp.]
MKRVLELTLSIALASIAAGAAAQEAPAEDTSKWRFLTRVGQTPVIVSEDVKGQAVKTVEAHTILGTRHSSGADGILTTFEVDCPKRTIKDTGSIALDGAKPLGKVPSQTKGEAVKMEPQTFFGAVGMYACMRFAASGDKKVITGKAAAIKYAKAKASGAIN